MLFSVWWTCKLSEIECMSIIVLTFAAVNGFAVTSLAVHLEFIPVVGVRLKP